MNHYKIQASVKRKIRTVVKDMNLLSKRIEKLLDEIDFDEGGFSQKDYELGKDEWYNTTYEDLINANEKIEDAVSELTFR